MARVILDGRPPFSPACARGCQAGHRALAYEFALELIRERAEEVEDELPSGGRRVDGLGERAKDQAASRLDVPYDS